MPPTKAQRTRKGSVSSNAAVSPTAEEEKISTSMLRIQYIHLENFKSYAGKHRIGPLHDSFTAIIGPNGSGKSNILDALLFVFGKRAKKIRLDKLNELIHSSAAHAQCTHASVAVEFSKGPSNDCSFFTLRRDVYQSGTSQYFLDDRKVSQSTIVTLLKEHGVDLDHNRFLILQGEVEQIAMMKPKAEKDGEEGFLEYLDDLIGTNQYAAALRTATADMQRLQEERVVHVQQVQKLSKERDLLESGKNAALNYVRKENQMNQLVSTLCQLKLAELERHLEPQRAECKSLEESLETMEAERATLQDCKESLESEMHTIQRGVKELHAQKEKRAEQRRALMKESTVLSQSAADAEAVRKRELDELKKLREHHKKVELQREDAVRDRTIARARVQENTECIERYEPELENMTDALRDRLKPLQAAIDAKHRALAPWAEQLREKEKRQLELEGQVDMERRRCEEATKALEEEELKLKAYEENTHKNETELKKIESEIHREGIPSDAKSGGSTAAEIEKELRDATQKKMILISRIEAARSEMKSHQTEDRVHTYLQERSAKGELSGYYGTLRTLGAIESKFDIAAGVASGCWGYHVVENEESASVALQLLRRDHQGRASFLVLSQIRHMSDQLRKPFQAPPNTSRLFDLIRIHDTNRFAPAFYYAVRDTLVAQSLTTARQYGLGGGGGQSSPRYRVVTVGGELVEPSGQVTGGGRSEALRGAGLASNVGATHMAATGRQSDRRGELATLQRDVTEVESNILRIQQALLQQRQREGNEAQRLEDLQRRAHELRVTMRVESSQRATAAKAVAQLRARAEEARRRLESPAFLQQVEQVKQLCRESERLQHQRSVLDSELEALHVELEAVGGEPYHTLRTRVQEAKAAREKSEQMLNDSARVEARLRAQSEKLERDIAIKEEATTMAASATSQASEDRAKMQSLQERLEKIEATIESLEHQIKDERTKIRDLEEHVKQTNQEATQHERNLEKKRAALEMRRASMEESRTAVRSYIDKRIDMERKIAQNIQEYGAASVVIVTGVEGGATGVLAGKGGPQARPAAPGSSLATERGDAEALEAMEAAHESYVHARIREDRYDTEVPPKDLANCTVEDVKFLAMELKKELERLRENIDFGAVQRWKEKDRAWREAKKVHDTIYTETVAAETAVTELSDQRKRIFMEAFGIIRIRLKELYQGLTLGGDADLELVDAHDPFEGINFLVRPPRKTWKQISYLSGGEKTLSSLAFAFALHHYKPTPLYVMDEIDAALDFRNVSIVAQHVLSANLQAQFLVVSLRNSMFEAAHQLIGVCKVRDCTQSIAVNPLLLAQTISRQLEEQSSRIQSTRENERRRPKDPDDTTTGTNNKKKISGIQTKQSDEDVATSLSVVDEHYPRSKRLRSTSSARRDSAGERVKEPHCHSRKRTGVSPDSREGSTRTEVKKRAR